MANSLISSLINLVDRQGVSSIASRLGESEQSVSSGLGPTFASILGGMANKTSEPGTMQQIYDMVSSVPADTTNMASLGNLASTATSTSPLIDMGKRLLPTLFGGNQSAVSGAIERTAGLGSGSGARLLAMAAPLVLGFLGKRVHEDKMGLSGFTNLLQSESADIKSYLPAGLSNLWSSATSTGMSAAHAVAAPVERKSSWLMPVGIGALALLAVLWFARRGPDEARSMGDRATTEGTRARSAVSGLGDFTPRQLPGGIQLNVPQNGVEVRLLSFIQDPSAPGSNVAWFDFDRLTFDTSSATLKPESEEQLRNIASIMKAYPNVRLKIGGYTDNTGESAANQQLSQSRAEAVKQRLIAMGISDNRLEAEGYGDQNAIADNSSEEGRAKNRRISMRVLQK